MKKRFGRLVLMGIPRWSDVGVGKRVRGIDEACSNFQGPERRVWLKYPAGV